MKIKNKKRSIIIAIIAIIVLVLISILIKYMFFNNYEITEFEKKINIYGYSEIYNNKRNTPSDKVTRIEAIKMVICAATNTVNYNTLISNFEGKNQDEKILNYAYTKGIVTKDEVNISNCYKKAKVIDLIKYISRAKYYILKKDYQTTENINIKDYNKYNDEEKIYILDLLNEEIIKNENYKLNAYKTLRKSLCNELIVRFIEKYNLLSILGKEIVTEKEKLPSNYLEYPYIVSDVDKEVYEIPFTVQESTNYMNPVDFYKYRKDYYIENVSLVEKYYNTILNVSYKTINYDEMYGKLKGLTSNALNTDLLKQYIEYVKNNQIEILGNASAQVPCIYNDGNVCRVRLKLEFEIKNALTRDNLLYMDAESSKIKIYDNNNYSIYIDARMGYVMGSNQIFVSQQDIYSMLLNVENNEIKVK